MRDDMNLVAKEYAVAQDPEDPGVLILSKFAGAAQQLTEALIVNPKNRFKVAEAIWDASNMAKDERVAGVGGDDEDAHRERCLMVGGGVPEGPRRQIPIA